MIIPEVTSKPIDRVAIEQERKFSIKPSAKAFRILSSTIYPDPIAAPIRELGTNAADSHKDAGVTDPFLVHLPNELEPYFSIRDYGTGISDENIDKVYCTYFESTRTGSNNFTGGFGLGSKTPFCYSDTFTVISYYNGRKMIFTAFLEDGEPKIAKFADDPTDERNGLEVSFPVKKEDIGRFVSTAKKVYSRFVDKPKIVGSADFNLEEVKYFMKGDGWNIRQGSNNDTGYYSNNNISSYVVMGNIAYPLDAYKVGGTEAGRALLGCGVEIQFGVGELQPTVSREHLQYDQDSVKKINERLSEICKELQKTFQKKIDESKNLFDARVQYGLMLGDSSEFNWQLKSVFRGMPTKYKGEEVSDNIILRNILIEYQKEKNPAIPIRSFGERYLQSVKNGTPTIKKVSHIDLVAKSEIEFFIDDLPKGGPGRLRNYTIGSNRIVYLIDSNIHNKPDLMKKLFDKIGTDVSVIKKTSSLPKVQHKKKDYVPKSDIREMLIYNGSDSYRHTYCWSTESIDTKDTKSEYYYIDINGYTPESIDMSQLYLLFSALKSAISPKKISVIGLRKTNANLKTKSNWINFIDYAKKEIKDYIDKNQLDQMIADSAEYTSFESNSFIEKAFIGKKEISSDSAMYDYMAKLDYMFEQSKSISKLGWVKQIESLRNIGLIGKGTVEPKYKLVDSRKEILEKYILLDYIIQERDTWRMPNPEKWKPTVLKYINSIKKS